MSEWYYVRMERIENHKTPKEENEPESVLGEPEIAGLIAYRGIKPGSLPLIEQLAQVSKNTLINGMHNFFAFNRDAEALAALKRSAERASTEEQKRMYELFLAFTEQNDSYAARHLVAVLEKR